MDIAHHVSKGQGDSGLIEQSGGVDVRESSCRCTRVTKLEVQV